MINTGGVDARTPTRWLDVASLEATSDRTTELEKKKKKEQNKDTTSRSSKRRSTSKTTHEYLYSGRKCDHDETMDESFGVDSAVCCLAITFYLADYLLDLILVLKYYKLQVVHPPYVVYFWLSLGFCLLPPILGIVYEFIWDCEESAGRTVEDSSHKMEHWIQTIFALLFLGPVIKFLLSIIYARKSRLMSHSSGGKVVETHWERRAQMERSQAAFLCVVEKFVESSLHLIHQLSLIRTEWNTEHRIYIDWIEWLKVGFCLFLMPFTLTVFASFRRSAEGRSEMNVTSGCVHFVWALLVVSSQAASMSLFATHQPVYFGVISVIHYCLAFVYVCTLALPPSRRMFFVASHHETSSSPSSKAPVQIASSNRASCGCVAAEGFHRLVVSYLFYFVFVHLKPGTSDVVRSSRSAMSGCEMTTTNGRSIITATTTTTTKYNRTGSTLHPAFVFYALLVVERGLMVVIWNENCVRRGPADVDCRPTLASFFAAFAAGLMLMIVYYTCCHPASNKREQQDVERSRINLP